MKFLADMGISPRVVDELRQKGHDAVHLSVIIFRLKDMRAANVSRHLSSILRQQSEALSKGAICSVTEQKVRTRVLPM